MYGVTGNSRHVPKILDSEHVTEYPPGTTLSKEFSLSDQSANSSQVFWANYTKTKLTSDLVSHFLNRILEEWIL